MPSRHSTDSSELRRAAETRIATLMMRKNSEDLSDLAHESEIRQIELEIQIEELRYALAEGEAERQRELEFFELAAILCLSVGNDGTILTINQPVASLVCLEREQLIGSQFASLIEVSERTGFRNFLQQTFETESQRTCELTLALCDQTELIVRAEARRSVDGTECRLILVDITEQHRMQAVLDCRTIVLQSIATGAPLSTTLHLILQKIEMTAPDMIASILLLEGKHLRHGASIRLTVDYCQAVDGLEIGPQIGSCGTAAFTGREVIVQDISVDPLWEGYRHLAIAQNLYACWSTPIFDSKQRVLGTFAIYYEQAGPPAKWHRQLIETVTDLAAIAISRHRSEMALSRSERRYNRLVESNNIGVLIARTDGCILEANEYLLKRFGYSRQDVDSGLLLWNQMTPVEWHSADFQAVQQILATGTCTPFEKEVFCSDGNRVRVLVSAALLDDSTGDCICLLTDLTERERAIDALRKSEASLAAAQARAHLGNWELDLTTMKGVWSAEMFRLFDRDPSQGTPTFEEFLKLVHSEDRAFVADFASQAAGSTEFVMFEFRTDPTAGLVRHLSANIEFIRNVTGDVVRMLGTTLDITELRKAEAAILRYETIFQQAGWGMVIADPETSVMTHVNSAFAKMHGYPAEEMTGMNLADTFAKDSLLDLPRHARICHESGHHTYESQHVRKDGSVFPCLTDVTAYKDSKGRILFRAATFEDITARKQAEEWQRQSQKMEAVGQLAGCVAHDFNNLLTVIDGYTMLMVENGQSDANREYLGEIQKASSRAAEFTRRLLTFGRRNVGSPDVIDVNHVIDDTLKMVEPLLGHRIVRHVSLDKSLYEVQADSGQISQIMLNLALNARDAMPDGGCLTITTENIELSDNQYFRTLDSLSGPFVLITVADTGCGIPAEILSRIFDPFFTTKPIGKGTGLGLSIVHNVVAKAAGHIELISQPGEGSTFRIYLPKAKKTVQNLLPANKLQAVARGTETILLVEDENSLRRLVRTILSGFGYNVLDAADSATALAVCRDFEHPIQLLLTDVMIPGFEGPELAEQVIRSRPGIRVLFMSGFIANFDARHQLLTTESFISKPFSPLDLARKVRITLDQ